MRQVGCPRQALAVGRCVEIDVGTDRHEAGRIEVPMAAKVMLLDVGEINGLRDSGLLVEVAGVRPEIRKVDKPSAIAFEVDVVNGIESKQRGE